MTRTPALILLLALGACAGAAGPSERDRIPTPQTATEAACRSEARNSEIVNDQLERLSPDVEIQRARVLEEARLAEARAYRDCLRRQGLAAPGGVEPVRRER